MNNTEFLNVVASSFKKYLETGSRSNAKLKILHGEIAKDIKERLGSEFTIFSLGIGNGKEKKLYGRYIEKAVDITIAKSGKSVAGIGVKFVMQNYSQNSNNYFENMLGETANIRCANIPYFQIFIIPDKLPYFNNEGKIQKWEEFTSHNSEKYLTLSKDDFQFSIHTPVKTLLYVIHLPETDLSVDNKISYQAYYNRIESFKIKESNLQYGEFSNAVIYNDYEDFANKLVYYIKFL